MSNQVNVNVTVGGAQPIIIRKQPGCLMQLLYFVFIGWWVGALAVVLAYLLFLTVIGIPLGVMLINRIPYLLALRETEPIVSFVGVQTQQRNFLLRALWFIVAGVWLTAVWLVVAYLFACTIIGMPIGFWMFDQAPALLTLHRR